MTYINLWIWAYGPDIAETPPGPPKIGEISGKIGKKSEKKGEKKRNFFWDF